jgi:hypothetical protein
MPPLNLLTLMAHMPGTHACTACAGLAVLNNELALCLANGYQRQHDAAAASSLRLVEQQHTSQHHHDESFTQVSQ